MTRVKQRWLLYLVLAGTVMLMTGVGQSTQYWTSRFPGELPETPVLPEVLNDDVNRC